MARSRASRESVAYQRDVAYGAAPRRHAQEELHVVRQPQAKPRRRTRGRVRLQQVACMTLVLSIAGAMIYGNVNLTRLTGEVSAQQSALEDLRSEYTALKARQDQSMNLAYVEQYAQAQLGMVRLDAGQVEYVEMNNPDEIQIRETGVSLRGAISGLTQSFSAILEYLE